jgi:hypothetical protein
LLEAFDDRDRYAPDFEVDVCVVALLEPGVQDGSGVGVCVVFVTVDDDCDVLVTLDE